MDNFIFVLIQKGKVFSREQCNRTQRAPSVTLNSAPQNSVSVFKSVM